MTFGLDVLLVRPLYAMATGLLVNLGSFVVAQADPAGPAGDLAPWVSSGSTLGAVAALVFMARQISSGRLVVLPIAQVIEAGQKRENDLLELLRLQRADHEAVTEQLANSNQMLGRALAVIETREKR